MSGLIALFQVILIDLILAGDNALVIGAIVARLEGRTKQSAMIIGIGLAIVLRLFFSLCAAWLLAIPAIGVIGGLILFYIAYKLYRNNETQAARVTFPAGLWPAVSAVAMADLSMSLDNILGVAAAATGHPFALVIGLIGSMVLMGVAANWIAAQMAKWPWLIYVGVAAIALTGLRMIVEAL